MPALIKIFGERNTSTNALKAMLEKNSNSLVAPSVARELSPGIRRGLDLARRFRMPAALRERMVDRAFSGRAPLEAWKHAATDFGTVEAFAGCHVIFCLRHPASWALGLHRRPYHVPGRNPDTLDDFLQKRWRTLGRERMGRSEVTAIGLYNAKLRSYLTLQDALQAAGLSFSVVRHEDFAIDQASVFETLAPFLQDPAAVFRPLEASTKDKTKSRAYYEDYYGHQRWLDEIDLSCRERLRSEVDWSQVATQGYDQI